VSSPAGPASLAALGLRAGTITSSYRRPWEGSNPMKGLILSQWAWLLTLALVLSGSVASAQEADMLSISGTFRPVYAEGTLRDDLNEVYFNGNEHSWTLTLYEVSYSNDFTWNERFYEDRYELTDEYITRVHATSFDFQFFGPDADLLNAAVSQHLTRSRLGDDIYLDLRNIYYYVDYYGAYDEAYYGSWTLGLLSDDAGISFDAFEPFLPSFFTSDLQGFPIVEPQRITADQSWIEDFRSGNSGGLFSFDDIVDIGSAEPPLPPTLSIADGQVIEGDRGTVTLRLIVTLSANRNDSTTVDYQTFNGTALAGKDYYAKSGRVLLNPGETSRTISITIKPDRKREPNETFTVRLSNPLGADIEDGVATATILSDD
jgi:hypothetical protein